MLTYHPPRAAGCAGVFNLVTSDMQTHIETFLSRYDVSLHAALVLTTGALAGLLIAIVAVYVLRRLGRASKSDLIVRVMRRAAAPMRVLLPLLGMSIVLPELDLGGSAGGLFVRIVSVVAIVAGGWLAASIVAGLVDFGVASNRIDHADNLQARRLQTQIRLLGRVAVCAVLIATAAAVLISIPSIRSIGVSLFASAGIAGLAVGIAARPVLSNVIAGIQIAITQPIRLEDVVVVEGEWGWIEEINLTFVVVRIWDLRRLVFPISYFIEKPFQNWTRNNSDILGSVFLHMDYTVPLDEVRAEFGRALRASPHWDGKVEVVHVTDCTDKTMQIRLLMSAASSPNAWELRCAVRERLIGYLQEHHPQALPKVRWQDAEGLIAGAPIDGDTGAPA